MWLQVASAAREGSSPIVIAGLSPIVIVVLAASAVVGALLFLALVRSTMGFLLSLVLKTLVVAANGAGILSLMILLASWLFVLPGTPFEMVLRGVSVEMLRGTSVEWVLRGLSVETGGNVYTLGGYAYDLSAFHQLTPSWDWERLRLGATIWVFVELLGLWTTRGNPIPSLRRESPQQRLA